VVTVKACLKPVFFEKVAQYKRGTLSSLSRDVHDGPLCDSLVYLCAWLRSNKPSLITESSGGWMIDYSKGYSSVVQGEGLCFAEIPRLVDPTDPEIADLLASELQRALREAIRPSL